MKKRKGFTLAELLAVIVILGIITSITVPIVTDQIDKYKTKVCISQYDNILNAARSYGADHLTELGKSQTITLKTLNDGGYIDASNMKDPITKNAISQDLKIVIAKVEKKYKYFIDNDTDIGCKDDYKNFYDKDSIFQGITSKEYTQGEKVSYLGYNWLVMKDNGDNTQLVMDGYLSADELLKNLPSDVEKSFALYGNSYEIKMCLDKSSKYCTFAYGNSDNNYSWNTSIIKPTIENWLNNKMTEKGLEKEKELKGMSFTDGVDTINSYVRIPVYDEVKTLDKYCDEKGPYCADNNDYMYSNYDYWVLTRKSSENAYFFVLQGKGGGLYMHHTSTDAPVRPVITVNEN